MGATILFSALFATVFGISYFFLITRNKERLALIHSGADASLFKLPSSNKRWGYSIVLVLGFLTMGIGLGIFIATLVEQQMFLQQLSLKKSGDIEYARESFPQLYIMASFFFGGLGLTSSFFLIRSLNKKDN